ncbi:MAG: serine hydrolase [Pyrinomonadaceae bacterium]
MVISLRVVSSVLLGCVFVCAAAAQKGGEILIPRGYKPPPLERSATLQAILENAVGETLTAFSAKGFKPEELTATVIDLRDAEHWKMADVRGEQRIYPASVPKMFYMAALQRQLEDGKVRMTAELARGQKDMIVDSSNEATQYILDVITDTSSGAELPEKEFQKWQHKRNRVNRYLAAMGYQNINVNQKTFCEDAYGIEQQSRGYKGQNRNMLTTNATARMLAEIVTGKLNTPERTRTMMDLVKRDPFANTKDPDDQAHGFTGKLLIDRKMTDAKIWSKAGWTSKARHDAAYIETSDGLKFVIVVFTENHATEKEAIPMVTGRVIDQMRK